MLEIIVTVPPARDRAARVRIIDAGRVLIDHWGVATADPDSAAHAGNATCDPLRPAGHPPLGRYELIAQGTPPPGTEAEYGTSLLLFEPIGGQALDAEAYGRLALLVHAGQLAPDATMRRTQGSLRLSALALGRLLQVLDATTPVDLRIEAAGPPPWWAFWRKARVHPPLSKRPPDFTSPPHDAATLLAELMKQPQRRRRNARSTHDEHDDHRRDRDTGPSSHEAPAFRGRGGGAAGAGASGSWAEAPAAGRGPGVDAAGRIAAAAGIAGTAAAVAAVSAAATSERAVPIDTASDDADGTNGAFPHAAVPDSGTTALDDDASAGDASGDAGWSAAATAY